MSENPYAAPQEEKKAPSPLTPADGSTISPYGPYRGIGLLQKTILSLLGLGILLAIGQIYALTKLNQANLLPDDDSFSEEQVDQAGTLSEQIETVDQWIFLLTIILWCFWKHRSCKNAWCFTYRAQGRHAVVYNAPSPGWAVGGYFVPLLHLYKPYQAMAFIRDTVSSKVETSMLLGLWWFTWLFGLNVGTIYLHLIGKSRIINEEILEVDDLTLYHQSLMMDNAGHLISCLFAAAVIYQLSVGQKRMARELNLG